MTHKLNSEAADKNTRARVNEDILEARALARALTGGGPVPSLRLYQFPSRKI